MLFSIQVIVWILYVFVFMVLLLNVVNPKYLWRKFESWKATDEPTAAYFRVRRITSVVGLIVMSLIMAGPSLLYWLDK